MTYKTAKGTKHAMLRSLDAQYNKRQRELAKAQKAAAKELAAPVTSSKAPSLTVDPLLAKAFDSCRVRWSEDGALEVVS